MKSPLIFIFIASFLATSASGLVFEDSDSAESEEASVSETQEIGVSRITTFEVGTDERKSTKSGSPLVEAGDLPAFPFRNYVGRVGMGSGVYMGAGYILTSAHVGCYPFQLEDGSFYRPDYGSWKVIVGDDGTPTDLATFRVKFEDMNSVLAGLPPLPIAKQTPGENAPVLLLGTGLQQRPEPATLKSGNRVLAVLGYHVDHLRRNLLGRNTVDQVLGNPIESGKGLTSCFSTRFDRNSCNAQASDGDSGGASFVYNALTEQWELAGCIIAVTQKSGFIPYGSKTFLANLSVYHNHLPAELIGDATETTLMASTPQSENELEPVEELPSEEEVMPM